MCQFSWWGSPCTGQKYRRWPLSLSPISGTASGRTYPIPAGGVVQNQEFSLGGQQPGTGKTHLAAAIGLALIEHGYRVLFARTTDLAQRLQAARRELALEAAVRKLDKFHLLVLD